MVPDPRERVARKQVTEAVRVTADWLGNTPAVARSSYVHPAVLDAYLDGSFRGRDGRPTSQPLSRRHRPPPACPSRRRRQPCSGSFGGSVVRPGRKAADRFEPERTGTHVGSHRR